MGLIQNIVNGAKNIATAITAANYVKHPTTTAKAAAKVNSTINNIKDTTSNYISSAKNAINNLYTNATNNAEDINTASSELMDKQNQYNREADERSYGYSRSYRQTAYQDTVKDMIAAGINPILAAQLGATGSGQFGTNSAVQYSDTTTKLDKKIGYLGEISAIIHNLASGRKTSSSAKSQKLVNQVLSKVNKI